jgi:hypothetical protein
LSNGCILEEADKELTGEAAGIKATKRMAYADCFAVGLARLRKLSFTQVILISRLWKKDIKVVWL